MCHARHVRQDKRLGFTTAGDPPGAVLVDELQPWSWASHFGVEPRDRPQRAPGAPHMRSRPLRRGPLRSAPSALRCRCPMRLVALRRRVFRLRSALLVPPASVRTPSRKATLSFYTLLCVLQCVRRQASGLHRIGEECRTSCLGQIFCGPEQGSAKGPGFVFCFANFRGLESSQEPAQSQQQVREWPVPPCAHFQSHVDLLEPCPQTKRLKWTPQCKTILWGRPALIAPCYSLFKGRNP